MAYSEESIEKLHKHFEEVHEKYQQLLLAYTTAVYSNDTAKEFATHGFLRRLKTLHRCIYNIYSISPPENDKKLAMDELADLTINLQAFAFNCFGCLDNLAWVFVHQQQVTNGKGAPLSNMQIGFGKKYTHVRDAFSGSFKTYLESLDGWFSYMEEYRHALAHRIPLYVPPFSLTNDEADKINDIEEKRTQALISHDFDTYKKLGEERDSLGKFYPCMTHSFGEKAKPVLFHSQILADWLTVVEIAEKLFSELNLQTHNDHQQQVGKQ